MPATDMIVQARKQQHLTQADLAEMAGVDVRSIRRIEAGAKASSNTIRSVCAALNLDASTLSSKASELDPADLKGILAERQGRVPFKNGYDNILYLTLLGVLATLLQLAPFSIATCYSSYGATDGAYYLLGGSYCICWCACATILVRPDDCVTDQTYGITRKALKTMAACSLVSFSMLLLPHTLRICVPFLVSGLHIAIACWAYRSMSRDQRRFEHLLQDHLELLIKSPIQTPADCVILEQEARKLATRFRTLNPTCLTAFEPLIWFAQDVRLGITPLTEAMPYLRLAGDVAQEATQSPLYAGGIATRHTATSRVIPLGDRWNNLRTKAIVYIERLDA